ncbi:hypothetical protein P5V15_010092 [Pogonomyrmex californicus]
MLIFGFPNKYCNYIEKKKKNINNGETDVESVLSIALHYRVGESIRTIIIETCSVIIDILPIYLKQLKEEDWLRICKGFNQIWNIMNVDKVERIIGACMPPQFHNIYAI